MKSAASVSPQIDEELRGIFCPMLTFLDLMIYNDIRTVLVLYATSLKNSETPQLINWFNRINELAIVQ